MTTINQDIKTKLAHMCATSDTTVINTNFMFNLMEYVDQLEKVAKDAAEAATFIRETEKPERPTKLENRLLRAINACEILNTCSPQRKT